MLDDSRGSLGSLVLHTRKIFLQIALMFISIYSDPFLVVKMSMYRLRVFHSCCSIYMSDKRFDDLDMN